MTRANEAFTKERSRRVRPRIDWHIRKKHVLEGTATRVLHMRLSCTLDFRHPEIRLERETFSVQELFCNSTAAYHSTSLTLLYFILTSGLSARVHITYCTTYIQQAHQKYKHTIES